MTQTVQIMPAGGRQRAEILPADVAAHRFASTVSSAGGGVVRLILRGDIDLAVRDRLGRLIGALLIGEGVKTLLIDMTGVTYLDCSAVGALVAGRHLAADVGCGYSLVGANGMVRRVLDLTGVWAFLELSPAGPEGAMPRRQNRHPRAGPD